jgi:hypothetical protein
VINRIVNEQRCEEEDGYIEIWNDKTHLNLIKMKGTTHTVKWD